MIDPRFVGVDSQSINRSNREFALCYFDSDLGGRPRLMNADEAIEFVELARKNYLFCLKNAKDSEKAQEIGG